MDVCLTCGGTGQIYAGMLHGRHKYRTCPRCDGAGEHAPVMKLKTTIEDRRYTKEILSAFCPKCREKVSRKKYYKSTTNTAFKCKCGCKWTMKIEDTIQE